MIKNIGIHCSSVTSTLSYLIVCKLLQEKEVESSGFFYLHLRCKSFLWFCVQKQRYLLDWKELYKEMVALSYPFLLSAASILYFCQVCCTYVKPVGKDRVNLISLWGTNPFKVCANLMHNGLPRVCLDEKFTIWQWLLVYHILTDARFKQESMLLKKFNMNHFVCVLQVFILDLFFCI